MPLAKLRIIMTKKKKSEKPKRSIEELGVDLDFLLEHRKKAIDGDKESILFLYETAHGYLADELNDKMDRAADGKKPGEESRDTVMDIAKEILPGYLEDCEHPNIEDFVENVWLKAKHKGINRKGVERKAIKRKDTVRKILIGSALTDFL